MDDHDELQMGLQIPRCLHPEVPEKTLYAELRKYLGEVFRKLAALKRAGSRRDI